MTRRARRWLSTVAAALAAGAIAWSCATMAQPRSIDETSVHAAYVINFLRYARWPAGADSGPFVVAVVGPADAAAAFRTIARDAGAIDGRTVSVRAIPVNVAAPDRRDAVRAIRAPLQGAHAVYVASSHDAWQRAVVEAATGQTMLTVGTGDFVARGGMFAFQQDRGRVRFSADPARITAARIDMSARVLKLARPAGQD